MNEQFASGRSAGVLRMMGLCVTALLIAAGAGCGSQTGRDGSTASKETGAASTNLAERQEFEVRGVIKELRPEKGEVVIKHETITNYMAAMTMPFEVKDTNELAGLATNNQVGFTLVVTKDEAWIENLRKLGMAEASSATNATAGQKERPFMRVVRDVDPLSVGSKMTDYTFTNAFGKKVSLSDFKGQAYAFTFIFTRCPLPTFCPRMSSNFSKVYEDLTHQKDAPTNWHLLSISFDPDFDTPERLKEYSASYNPDPKKWDWVTGAMIDIDAITEQFGLVFEFDKGNFNHTLRTVVVDKNGVVRKILIGNEWSTEELEKELIAGAKGEAVPEAETP